MAKLVPTDDRLMRLVPVLDFISAHLDVAATTACLNRTFRQEMGVFRARVEDVGEISLLAGVGGGTRDMETGRIEGPLADTAFLLVARFYSGLVNLSVMQCTLTQPLLLLLPDACPKLRGLALHRIEGNYNPQHQESLGVWAHLSNFWGPERTTPQTVKKLQIRMPNLQVAAYYVIFCVHFPPHLAGSVTPYVQATAFMTIREAYTNSLPQVIEIPNGMARGRGRPPADARLVFRGRQIRDDETFLELHRSLDDINGNDESWFEALDIHVEFTEEEAAATATVELKAALDALEEPPVDFEDY